MPPHFRCCTFSKVQQRCNAKVQRQNRGQYTVKPNVVACCTLKVSFINTYEKKNTPYYAISHELFFFYRVLRIVF